MNVRGDTVACAKSIGIKKSMFGHRTSLQVVNYARISGVETWEFFSSM